MKRRKHAIQDSCVQCLHTSLSTSVCQPSCLMLRGCLPAFVSLSPPCLPLRVRLSVVSASFCLSISIRLPLPLSPSVCMSLFVYAPASALLCPCPCLYCNVSLYLYHNFNLHLPTTTSLASSLSLYRCFVVRGSLQAALPSCPPQTCMSQISRNQTTVQHSQ